MNVSKAREFFSEYHEGTLEPGLREAFERALASDAQVQAEYQAFERLMTEMAALPAEEFEPPFDLHERISARVDRDIWEGKRRRGVRPGLRLRLAFYGGLAALALVAAGLSIWWNGGDADLASPVPAPAPSGPKLSVKDGVVHLVYRARQAKVTVSRGIGGPVVQTFVLKHQLLDCPLRNDSPDPAVVSIDFGDPAKPLLVVLPGTARTKAREGDGTALDLAVAFAGVYDIPVQVEVNDLNGKVHWKFDSTDPLQALPKAASEQDLSLDQPKSGIYVLRG